MRRTKRLCALALGIAMLAAPMLADVNRIVLRVNDHIATLHDYQSRYGEQLRALQAAQLPPDERARRVSELGENVFREMFDELLLLAKAGEERIQVTEAMVDDAVQGMREANGLTDSEAFEAALAGSGMTREALRKQARQSILLQQVTARELQSRVDLDEEDLRRYYQSHLSEFAVPRRMQLRSIVVLESSGLDEARRMALAEEAADLLASEGVELEAWVTTHREAQEATDLIDLGWVQESDLDKDIETAVWELESGAVTEPVAGRGGLHVVQVLGVEDAHVAPFNEVKDQVRQLEMGRLRQEAVTRMLAELEESSFIRIDPPPEAAGFRTTRAILEDPLASLPGGPEAAPEGEDER